MARLSNLWTNHCFEFFDSLLSRFALPWYALLPASLPDIVRCQRSFSDSWRIAAERQISATFLKVPLTRSY